MFSPPVSTSATRPVLKDIEIYDTELTRYRPPGETMNFKKVVFKVHNKGKFPVREIAADLSAFDKDGRLIWTLDHWIIHSVPNDEPGIQPGGRITLRGIEIDLHPSDGIPVTVEAAIMRVSDDGEEPISL